MHFTNILIPFVYFIAGATTLAGVATTFYYKEDLHLTISQVQILASIGIIPWSIKPLYGFLSDRCPFRGLRRKPYLFLSGLLGFFGYLSLATWVSSFTGVVVATMVSAIGFAMADVIVDGIVAERSRTQKEAGKLQSVCRGALLFGALIVSYASGVLVETIGARNVFLVTSMLPLFTSVFALLVQEDLTIAVSSFSFRDTWQRIREACSPGLLWAALFLFIWRSMKIIPDGFSLSGQPRRWRCLQRARSGLFSPSPFRLFTSRPSGILKGSGDFSIPAACSYSLLSPCRGLRPSFI